MKINLKYQLCALVSLTALFAVGLLALITWYYSSNLVSDLRSSRLEVIALLKSKELTQILLVLSTTATSLAARVAIVNALTIPETHENFTRNWTTAGKSLSVLLSTYPDVLYISVQNTTLERCYLNITSLEGNRVFQEYGIVPENYYGRSAILDSLDNDAAYNALHGAPGNVTSLIPAQDRGDIGPANATRSGLFLGPLMFNTTTEKPGPIYIASLTVPVYNNTTALLAARNILGYMTVVFNLQSLIEITRSTEGLGRTGQVLLLGPESRMNRWDNTSGEFKLTQNYQYILPPANNPHLALQTFPIVRYPIAMKAWENANGKGGVAGVELATKDAFGTKSSVGYASVSFDATNSSFLLMVEQTYAEAFEPIHKLRTIVLATVFGTIGIILLVTFPTAHYAVRPIRRLHEATKLCGRPPEYREEPKRRPWWSPFGIFQQRENAVDISDTSSQNSSGRRDNFRIPQKVPLGKHLVADELTALIATFNVMTEELLEQYEKLEEKVHQRTEELQQQTILAESANDAKTMFIANVSHELRTPLNGILGMCSLVLEENLLPATTRESLEVVFKSGQLLLHLLNDLITFSKNQVWGAQVKLENSPFRVRDFVSQIAALFGTQARDKSIELTYEVVPRDGGDFVLVGDVNRILQVIINLISNSLKFTDEGGSVQLMIVMESLPNADSPANSPGSAPKSPDCSSPPLSPSSPSSPSSKPTRPPLFTRRSTTSGANNTETDITKTFLTRSKKFLNPGTAAQVPRSSTASPSASTATTHYVEFRVIDTGPGVPEGMQKKIFEPFVQADVGLSRKYGGTGLGLSICQQLAKLMGGDIHLKSFEGAGSTFSLRIPLHLMTGSITSAASNEYSRPLSASRKSAHTTTKSLSAFSGAAFSGCSGHDSVPAGAQDGNLRLVGLSQPFFVPSRAESENDFPLTDTAPPPPHEDADPHHPMTPVTEVDTPACSLVGPQSRKFEFPATVAGPSGTGKKLEEEPQGEGKGDGDGGDIRVLVAEDNKINQKLVVKVLQLEGVSEVTVAEDGREAVDRVKEAMDQTRVFDIIFMDIQMPNVDGHEATRQIRAMGYKAPIVALTAFAEESNIKECYETGMDCFLSKPIKRPQIRQMIETYCPGKGSRPVGKSST
ncbi:hypothetical protein K440DRAFT_607807 [Wilcoxina mikolae CBS 423.85]|nr:hypothetical protein K440DRAFT_607807 [Wilcoxina mikolae CBS 423.85]